MKICLIMAGDEEGGLENHFTALCRMLAADHDIHVIAHPRYQARLAGVSFHPLDLTHGRGNPWLLLCLLRLLRRLAPDIVHAHANKATALLARLRALLPRTVRLVATLHSQKRRLGAFEKMDLVIGVSARVLQPLRKPRTAVIYPGLDTANVRRPRAEVRTALGIPESQVLIVAAGRLVPVKRFDLLIDAVAGLPGALLLIAGSGTLHSALEAQASRNAPQRVRLLGQRDDVPDLLGAADLCVISSEREGFSHVMAESLLAHTPVVATDVADMRVLLPPGCVVECGDSNALRDAIAAALDDPSSTRRAFAPCYEWARSQLVPARVRSETNRLYTELAGR